MADNKRKGGLGRGIANLIPTATNSSPRLGDGAADIVLGGTRGAGASTSRKNPPKNPVETRDSAAKTGGTVAPSPRRTGRVTEAPATNEYGAVYQEIPVASISPNPAQPRQVFDEDALGELVHSIKEFGLMQPVIVRPRGDRYELIMGERRWRATTQAGLETIPAIIRQTDDNEMLRDALLENIHRVQLNPLEEAAAYAQLLEDFGVTHAQLAETLGRSRPVISNMIRLLELPVEVQHRVAAGVLSAGHARALLGLTGGPEAQIQLASRIVAEGLSVRATEEAVTLANNHGVKPKKKAAEKKQPPEFARRAASLLADDLDTHVTVTVGAKNRGKIVVEFADKDDLERILSMLHNTP